MLYDAKGKKIEKELVYSNEVTGYRYRGNEEKPRGVTVYNLSEIRNFTGRDQHGRLLSVGTEDTYFSLTVQQRIDIFKSSSPIFGVVSSRMNRLSGLNFNITTQKKDEDRIAEKMKDLKMIYTEIEDSVEIVDLTKKATIVRQLHHYLPDLKEDLSNFNGALLRWKKRIRFEKLDRCEEISDWLQQPNNGNTWEQFIKEYVFDLMVHGTTAIYKDVENNKLTNFGLLPGGTVYRIKEPYFSGKNGYIQVINGLTEPQVYFDDEIVYSEYLSSSGRNYGFIPLEALINKIAESLLFDKLMAEQADGTKPPEKLIIVTESNPFGSLDNNIHKDIPLNDGEQRRVEEKINQPVKGATMTVSGNGVEVVDLSRESTMETQRQRQKDIREEVALVFNMSNMEVNLTGSENTSGRSTSEAQMEIEQGKGIAPIAKDIESVITRGILPYRFGSGYMFEFEKSRNEKEESEIDLLELQTGKMTQNEIREKYNKTIYVGEEFDKPKDAVQETGESEMSPMFTRNV